MTKSKIKFWVLVFCILCSFYNLKAQGTGGYNTTAHGLKYKILRRGNSGKIIMEGYYVSCRWWLKTMKDSVLTSSDAFGTTPEFQIKRAKNASDVFEGFLNLSQGDSATMLLLVDSAYKGGPPPFAKKGEMLKYTVSILDVYTPSEYALMRKLQAKKQKEVDETLIKEYLKQNNLKGMRTDSGIYYVVNEPGTLNHPHAGQKVSVNYTGALLDGTKFDSNILPEFHHVEPFNFTLGTGSVIKGWDLGISLLGYGGKGILIIPSHLAYGNFGSGDIIKPDAVLVFDIEVLDNK